MLPKIFPWLKISPWLLYGASFAALISAQGPALADDAISVHVNMARVLRVNAPASTVIVGNPGVADVTIQDAQTLVLTGKAYGQTNLIVLDNNGDPVADTLIEVSQEQSDLVTVYVSGARTSVSCTPKCTPTVMVGDAPNYTETVTQSYGLVKQMFE
jgi:Flp pilus assembly secretin CpaC